MLESRLAQPFERMDKLKDLPAKNSPIPAARYNIPSDQ